MEYQKISMSRKRHKQKVFWQVLTVFELCVLISVEKPVWVCEAGQHTV